MMKVANRTVSVALVFICFLFSGCADMFGPNGGSRNIRPIKLNINNTDALVLVGGQAVKSTGDVYSPSSLMSMDENGNLSCTVFYFESEESTAEDGTLTSFEKECQESISVVPASIYDVGKYIFFKDCYFSIDKAKASESLLEAYREQGLEYAHYDYLLRKSDGALFDISGKELFRYLKQDISGGYYPVCFWDDPMGYVFDKTCFAVHNDAMYVMNNNKRIHKLTDRGDYLDIAQVTMAEDNAQRMVVDNKGNIFFSSSPEFNYFPGTQWYAYFADGGFGYFDLEKKAFHSTVHKRANGDIYVFLLKNKAFRIYADSGKLRADDVVNSSDGGKFDVKNGVVELGEHNGVISWYSVLSPAKLSFDFKTGVFSYKELGDQFKFDTGLQLGGNGVYYDVDYDDLGSTVAVTYEVIDLVNETVTPQSYTVDVEDLLNKKFKTELVDNVPVAYISGRSPKDGTTQTIQLNVITGEVKRIAGTDNREIISLLKIN